MFSISLASACCMPVARLSPTIDIAIRPLGTTAPERCTGHKKEDSSSRSSQSQIFQSPDQKLNFFFFFPQVISMPNVGLELTIWASRVTCFTQWASQRPRILAIFLLLPYQASCVLKSHSLYTWSQSDLPLHSH